MTFESNIQSTWGEALADLRDKVGGLTNWSIKDDTTGGATSIPHNNNDYFVLTSPLGEDFRFYVDNYGFRVEHGPDWDATNDVWNDRYANDPATLSYQYFSLNEDSYGDTLESDTVNYYIEYVDRGFIFYAERQEGDGYDADAAFGVAELTKVWDYTTAQNRESRYTILMDGHYRESEYDTVHHMYGFMSEQTDDVSGETRQGQGILNPDGNYSNYVMQEESLVASQQYENGAGHDAFIGTHNLWLEDMSGTNTAHDDTVQDSNANNVFTIVKAHVCELAMRMD